MKNPIIKTLERLEIYDGLPVTVLYGSSHDPQSLIGKGIMVWSNTDLFVVSNKGFLISKISFIEIHKEGITIHMEQ